MASRIISSFSVFSKQFPELDSKGGKLERIEALKKYFSNGGVVSVETKGKSWPKLVYPPPSRIKSQVQQIAKLKAEFERKHRDWNRELNEAKVYGVKHNILKLSSPLYWKHLAKLASNSDYKKDAETVQLPAHLVADKRWKPMIQMFVENIEYRKNLVETVENSIVYRDDKRVGKYANEIVQFKTEITSKKLGSIKKKISALKENIDTFELMLKWAQER